MKSRWMNIDQCAVDIFTHKLQTYLLSLAVDISLKYDLISIVLVCFKCILLVLLCLFVCFIF